jgi:hypothetical protein
MWRLANQRGDAGDDVVREVVRQLCELLSGDA